MSPVPGLRDILGPRMSEAPAGPRDERPQVVVVVRAELLGAAGPGWHLTARVRLTPSGTVAEPHPAEGDFRVEPPP